MQPSAGFSSDPVVGAPSARSRASDAVGQPVDGTDAAAAHLPGLGLANGLGNGGGAFFSGGEGGAHMIPIPPLRPQQPGFQHSPDSFQASPSHGAARGGQWSPTALQQLLDQHMADQALAQQLQAQLQLDQAMGGGGSPGALAQLLQQQQLQQEQHQPAAGLQCLPPLPAGQWPGLARSPPPLPAALLPGQAELPGTAKHGWYGAHEDKKHRAHGPGAGKGRAADADAAQGGAADKLRREVARLHGELERLEREVGRQKALRETERGEFTDAKDRLKHSWAADREDFARVKAALKAKNAEHHAQCGRLSQQLKELEAANRGLRELAARAGLALPPELELPQARQPPARDAGGGGPAPASSAGPESLPSAEERSLGLSRAPSEASFDSDLAERLALRAQLGWPQPPSPTSAAGAVLAMVRQLPRVLAAQPSGAQLAEERAMDADGPGDNEAAAAAAAQAAAALGQLAAALAGRSGGSADSHASTRPVAPADALSSGSRDELGDLPVGGTHLNRMSLQAWVQHADASDSGSMSPVSRRSSLRLASPAQLPEHRSLEFPRVALQPAPDSPRAGGGGGSRPPSEAGTRPDLEQL